MGCWSAPSWAAPRPRASRWPPNTLDVHLIWGEPLAAVAEKPDRARAAASTHGRTLYGIQLHTVARNIFEAAWAGAGRLFDQIDQAEIGRIRAKPRRSVSGGQRRMLVLNGGLKDDLEIDPNLWAGAGLVRGGAGTARVGSFTEIADLMEA
ncbi:LLM class flavin-dependent oxidoreductase [Streptomyces sp. NPDC058964]|uniref:LLM class flavin-dependent oxidoreductase n=1 Tax=Streptomyces sp. NPDC058964 TaxID=3346681 RepID=UPI0036A4E4FE